MSCRRVLRIVFAFTLVALAASTAIAQYNPPATYYNSAIGTGATLKSQLQSIVSNMTGVNYGNARYSAPYTDADPNNSGNVILIYNRASVSSTWDSGSTWNREHIWPVSRLGVSDPGNSTTNLASDQFNLRPANPSINSSRGNKPFGMDSTTGAHGHQGSYYFPGDADAGDVARAQFYMSTRYSQLVLTDGSPSGTQMGDLSSLVNYHFRDVPDDFERRRNHAIYGLAGENSQAISNPHKQSNRNPYVDHPEYVWSVFVDQMNDSRITIQGGASTGSGGTSLDVNLGRVLIGAPVPASQQITLNKQGNDGAYFKTTTGGAATSSLSGPYHAFKNGTTDSKTLNVGLATSTSVAGLKSGTVAIDNLDITTQGGVGVGANDMDDLVNVSLSVLDHANPSFVGGSDVNAISLDFGAVAQGSTVPSLTFDLFNLSATAGYTAGLDLDSITGSGSTSTLTTSLGAFSNLAAGQSQSFTASIDTTSVGAFSAMYTLNFSDENLPGASGVGQLIVSLTGVVGSAIENADFNLDGAVDGMDFLTWQRGFGTSGGASAGDANGDGVVDGVDLTIWSNQFGESTGIMQVPEPASLVIAAIAWASLASKRPQKFRAVCRERGLICWLPARALASR